MSLDPDLQALSDKIDRLSGLGDKAQFSPEQQGLLDKALARQAPPRRGVLRAPPERSAGPSRRNAFAGGGGRPRLS